MAVHTIPLCLFAWPHQDFMRCPRTPELHEGISLDTGYQLSLSWPEVYTRRESNPRPGKISVLTPLCHLSYACAPEGCGVVRPTATHNTAMLGSILFRRYRLDSRPASRGISPRVVMALHYDIRTLGRHLAVFESELLSSHFEGFQRQVCRPGTASIQWYMGSCRLCFGFSDRTGRPFTLVIGQYGCTHHTALLVCLTLSGLVRCPRSPSLLCWA